MRRLTFALLALLSTACSGGDDDAAPPTTVTTTTVVSEATTTTSVPVEGSEGCGGVEPVTDDQHLIRATIESSGGTREYMVYVPDAYDPAVPAPVAYVFHGAGSTKEEQLIYSEYRPYAEEDGALLVLPDALGDPARWSPFGPAAAGVEGVNDIAFFDDLEAAVERDLCVDGARVLVSGMSSGGFMSAAVGCTRSDRVSAVGPVTATVWADAVCVAAEPLAYVYFHGTDDVVVPYEGGPGSPGPVEETSQAWATQNGCTAAPVDERIGTEVVHRTWSGCDAPTDLYTVEGGGHSWPGAIALDRLGYTTDDIDASEIIWTMFRETWPGAT